ncbi:MAG: DNA/RNA nuclease SfsA [Acidaminococcaceae bacterium]
MEYHHIKTGYFLARPNRFIAQVELAGKIEICHVKNTGRCQELLTPRAVVYVEENTNPKRKTKYDLIAVQKGTRLINMDSQAPNQVVHDWLLAGGLGSVTALKPESTYGKSRLDFYLEIGQRRIYLEVKGVTLETDGIVRFPDAPTERGLKHLHELAGCIKDGFEAYVLFVIQMQNVQYFKPNYQTHPAFGLALQEVAAQGVHLLAYDCLVTPTSLVLNKPIPVRL